MITYNHEKYIEQAVRSVMMQETDFDYELLIGEDCSTDRTREIVLHLGQEFPEKIRVVAHPTNQGMASNFIALWNMSRGQYIAILDGDDCWIDSRKLQIQADLLDREADTTISIHSYRREYVDLAEYGDSDIFPKAHRNRITPQAWAHKYSFIGTLTVMMRKVLPTLPDWMHDLRAFVDYPLYLITLQEQGGVIRILEGIPRAIYRVHSTSATNLNRGARYELWLRDLELIRSHVDTQFHAALDHQTFYRKRDYLQHHIVNGDLVAASDRKSTRLNSSH